MSATPPVTAALRIRLATPADAARLADVAARTFTEKWTPHNTPEDMATYLAATFGEAIQRAELQDPASTYLLAEIDGEVVGYARLHAGPAPACVSGPAPLELERLYVLAAWHGHRVGAALMTEVFAEARRQGARTLWLGVWPENHQARRFYEARGFRKVGTKVFQLGAAADEDQIMERAVDV